MLRVAPDVRPSIDVASAEVRAVVRNFVPVFVSRGVVQLSAYMDTLLASLLPTGAVAALTNAQLLYTLPVSLFGMSVSAAELPAMSGEVGVDPGAAEPLRRRLDAGLRQIAFFVIPSAMAFLALGDVIAAALFQTGRFTREDAVYVWGILAGSAVGLLASTLGRLYSSTYYALRDTRTPLRYAARSRGADDGAGLPVRDAAAASAGTGSAVGRRGPDGVGRHRRLGRDAAAAPHAQCTDRQNRAAGRVRRQAVGVGRLSARPLRWAVKLTMPAVGTRSWPRSLSLGPYGIVFFAGTWVLRVPEASSALSRIARRFR